MSHLRKNQKRILGESILEDDPAILDVRVDSNDNNDEANKATIDDDSEDDLEDSETDIPVQFQTSTHQHLFFS